MTTPRRYVSTYTNLDGVRVWGVIGHGGAPEVPFGVDLDAAVTRFLALDDFFVATPFQVRRPRRREIIPVWHGDECMFRNLGDLENPAEPDRPLPFGHVPAGQLLEPFCDGVPAAVSRPNAASGDAGPLTG